MITVLIFVQTKSHCAIYYCLYHAEESKHACNSDVSPVQASKTFHEMNSRFLLCGSKLFSPAGGGTETERGNRIRKSTRASQQAIAYLVLSVLKIFDTGCLYCEKPVTNSFCSITWTGSAISELYLCFIFLLVIPDKY